MEPVVKRIEYDNRNSWVECRMEAMYGACSRLGVYALHFADPQTLAYVAGRMVVIMDIDSSIQISHIPITELAIVHLLTSNYSKKISNLALFGYNDNMNPCCYILQCEDFTQMQNWEKKKSLPLMGTRYNRLQYISAQFSVDGKRIVSLLSDYTIIIWLWDKQRKTGEFPANANLIGNVPLWQISFSKLASNYIGLTGYKVLRVWKLVDQSYKLNTNINDKAIEGLPPIFSYTVHCWIDDDKMAVGTNIGTICIIANRDILYMIDVKSLIGTQTSKRGFNTKTDLEDENDKLYATLLTPNVTIPVATAICSHSRGFVVGYSSSILLHFMPDQNVPDGYQQIGASRIPGENARKGKSKGNNNDDVFSHGTQSHTTDGDHSKQLFPEPEFEIHETESEFHKDIAPTIIQCVAVSPAEDYIIAFTEEGTMFYLPFAQVEQNMYTSMTSLGQQAHVKSINDLDVCKHRPLFATVGGDKVLKLWDYETKKVVLSQEFVEDIHSCCLHPLAFFVGVALMSGLFLYSIRFNSLSNVAYFPIRSITICRFSNGGHLIASAAANAVQITSTVDYCPLAYIQENLGKINDLAFNYDDTIIACSGSDGSVHAWRWATSEVILLHVSRLTSCPAVRFLKNSDLIMLSCEDAKLKFYQDNQLKFEHPFNETNDFHTYMSSLDVMYSLVPPSNNAIEYICGGSTSGNIIIIKSPVTTKFEFDSYLAHSGDVRKIKFTQDVSHIISVGTDLTIAIWSLTVKGRAKQVVNVPTVNNLICGVSQLEEMKFETDRLRNQIVHLTQDFRNQLRKKDDMFHTKTYSTFKLFDKQVEKLLDTVQDLIAEDERQKEEHAGLMELLDKQANDEAEKVKFQHEYSMKYEKDRYGKTEEDFNELLRRMKSQVGQYDSEKDEKLKAIKQQIKISNKQLYGKVDKIKKAQLQVIENTAVSIHDIEQDAELEILGLKTDLEEKLKIERDKNVQYKNEMAIMQQKYVTLDAMVKQSEELALGVEMENKKVHETLRDMQSIVEHLKNEITDREELIADKEKRSFELKKTNQELEKFKFVLEFKINELQEQFEPKAAELRDVNMQTLKMEQELVDMHHRKRKSQFLSSELRSKVRACEKQFEEETDTIRQIKTIYTQLQTDIWELEKHMNSPKELRKGIIGLFKKYLDDQKTTLRLVMDDSHSEYHRKRHYLEGTLANLKINFQQNQELQKVDALRVMSENVTLLHEMTKIREELKITRRKIHDLQNEIGIGQIGGLNTVEKFIEAYHLFRGNHQLNSRIVDLKKLFELQKEEIINLKKSYFIICGGRAARKIKKFKRRSTSLGIEEIIDELQNKSTTRRARSK
ncbi:hypothetical protein SNEBB_003558 [Seison nebaliae]|nr:hypothetical protein SNEBB_003558 [Seison nebaliae]